MRIFFLFEIRNSRSRVDTSFRKIIIIERYSFEFLSNNFFFLFLLILSHRYL